jgi:microcompartment protein CcmL/EutN
VKEVVSLGIIETFSIASCIIAADAAAKAANITLIEIRLARGLGGKAFTTLTGELHSVEAALGAATAAIEESGMLTMTTIIPAPHKSLSSVII